MKKRMLNCIVGLLVMIMALPIIPGGSLVAEAATAKPTLSISKKTIIGIGATYTISVKNQGKNVTKYKWYSTNNKVVTVKATSDPTVAKVTTVGKGTAYIKCGVFYKDGDIKRPASQFTVKIPATEIKFTNALDTEENNNRHVIAVGETYDFNAVKVPSNASDKIYYFLDKGDEAYAKLDSITGKVTGIKPGFIRLTVVASMTKEGAADSKINDAINIEIVEKTTKVNSAEIVDSTTLKVTFNGAINPDTIIDKDKKLKDTIIILAKTDEKNNMAKGLGELTATLSDDGKTLTIQAQHNFDGVYGIMLTSDVKAKDGSNLQPYSKTLTYYDKVGPVFVKYTTDDTGLKATMHFSEAIDFSRMDLVDVKTLNSNIMTATTRITLLQKNNYVVSQDKKSLTIDLTNMDVTDQNKLFELHIAGLTDLAGNPPASNIMKAYLTTDTTPKPQARLINITRTSYDTLTALFDRPIRKPGNLIITSNYDMPVGVVDKDDARKVHYKMSSSSVLLTGLQTVTMQKWDSYNVAINDTTAYTPVSRQVDFNTDKTIPQITKYELKSDTLNNVDVYKLEITYTENVALLNSSGILLANLVTTNNDIYSNRPLSYTAVAQDNVVTLLLNSNEILQSGTYTIEIPDHFVRDAYMNYSTKTTIRVVKDAAISSNLPAPRAILQSSTDNNIIEVIFGVKVDEASAQNIANYRIPGVSIISAKLTDNNDQNGARIELRLQPGSIPTSAAYFITVSGITGFHNTYSAMKEHTELIYLKENVAPGIISAILTYPNLITITFTEPVTGTPAFKVTQGGIELGHTVSLSDSKILITLNVAPNINGQPIVLEAAQNNVIKDMNGNVLTFTIRSVPVTF